MRDDYWRLVGELSNTLCRQDRFAEATAMLEEQGRWLKTRGGSGTDQVRLDALRGAVLARSGNAREALPILEAVATNRLSDVEDWLIAAVVAAGTGDHASFQRLSRICWLRFGSTVEGNAALFVVTGLYQQPMDDEHSGHGACLDGPGRRRFDRQQSPNQPGQRGPGLSRASIPRGPGAAGQIPCHTQLSAGEPSTVTDPAQQASLFIRALLSAELGRTEEARRDFAQARAQLKLALGDKPGHDRGENWPRTYQAESWQREAEALFQAKGIPLPEPDAK